MLLRPWELEQYTLGEFLNALHGFNQASAQTWQSARILVYHLLQPHLKKNHRLELSQLLHIPLFDKPTAPEGAAVAKAYRLTPQEIEQWHEGTWQPPE